MHKLRVAALALTLTACATRQASVSTLDPIDDPRAVLVIKTCGSAQSMGSGTITGPRRVLTAWHVVRCPIPVSLEIHRGKDSVHGLSVFGWPDRDTAVVALDATLVAPTVAFGPTPEAHDRLCGSAAHPVRWRTCGAVTPTKMLCENGFCSDFDFRAIVTYGNSGAAAYDSRNRLVGIITGSRFLKGTDISIGESFVVSVAAIVPELTR